MKGNKLLTILGGNGGIKFKHPINKNKYFVLIIFYSALKNKKNEWNEIRYIIHWLSFLFV